MTTGAWLAAFAAVLLLGYTLVAALRSLEMGLADIAAALHDIAAAIRERGPDLHVQLRDVPPAAGKREV